MNTQTQSFPPFIDMVKKLFKAQVNNPAADALMHAAIGIVGEAIELRNFTNRDNFIEEASDLEFYIVAMRQHLDTNIDMSQVHGYLTDCSKFVPATIPESLDSIVGLSGEVVDLAKKHWVYRKPLESGRIAVYLGWLNELLLELYKAFGTTREEVIYFNQDKLIGPKGRFRSGFYSDQAAQDRADKAPSIYASPPPLPPVAPVPSYEEFNREYIGKKDPL